MFPATDDDLFIAWGNKQPYLDYAIIEENRHPYLQPSADAELSQADRRNRGVLWPLIRCWRVQEVIVDLLPDSARSVGRRIFAWGNAKRDIRRSWLLLQASGGPRQRGYSSKARAQIQIVSYSYCA